MLKQANSSKALTLKAKYVPLFGHNMKKKLSHLMDLVKINSLSGNTQTKDTNLLK